MTTRSRRGGGRRRWRFAAPLGVAVVAVASLAGGGVAPVGAAIRPADGRVVAMAGSAATVPGGDVVIGVHVSNVAPQGSAGWLHPTVQINGPDAYVYAGMTDLSATAGFVTGRPISGHWSCRAGASYATCTFSGVLPAGRTLPVLLRFAPVHPVSVNPGGHAVFNVVGMARPISIPVVAGPAYPALYAAASTRMSGRTGGGAETVDVVNSGPAAATSVQLSNLLPAAVVGRWTASGSGWSCAGLQGEPPSCAYRGTIRPGAVSQPLRISFSVDAAKRAALHLRPGAKPAIEKWSVGVVAQPGGHVESFPSELAVSPPPAAKLRVTAVAANGREELMPGAETTIAARIANVGGTTTGSLELGGALPAGVSIVRAGGWQCRDGKAFADGSRAFACSSTSPREIANGKRLTVRLVLAVAQDARPGQRQLVLGAHSANETSARDRHADVALPLLILEPNRGFPALIRLRPGRGRTFVPATDGRPLQLVSGRASSERLDVRNAGGAAIAAGSRLVLTQNLGPGATVAAVSAPLGWSCSGTHALTCSYTVGAALAPAASIQGPVVSLLAHEPTKKTADWPAEVHLVAGAPHVSKLPVLVDVSHGAPRLVANWTNGRVPTAGGTGSFGLAVRNAGNLATPRPVSVGIRLPRGVHLVGIAGAGWSCSSTRGSARCTSAALEPGARSPRLRVVAGFAARTGLRTIALPARAYVEGESPARARVASIQVEPRHALHARISEPDKVYFADKPLVRPGARPVPTAITLEGDGSGGSGLGLTYRWRQTAGPAVTWLGPPTEADVRFQAPQVTRPAVLGFALTVTDGSATSSAGVRIKVVPLESASQGFTIRNAHPQKERLGGPLHEKRPLPKPARPLHGVSPAPAQTATSRARPLHRLGPHAAPPAIFCQLVQDAQNAVGGSFTASVGSVTFGFSGVQLTGSGCNDSTQISFTGGTFTLDGALDASGIAGTITENGIALTGGSLKGPSAWHSPTFTLSGLTVPFGGSSIAISGTVSGSGIAFVPLPSGWNGTTTLTFAAGGGNTTTVSASVTATGPKRDASPDSPAPSLSIQGAIASDGTFSLSLDIRQLVQLAGSPIDVSGSVKRTEPHGPIAISLSGTLTQPVTIVSGLQIASLTVHAEPTDTSLGLKGSGTIELSTPSGKIGVAVGFAYDDPANWSLTAQGTGDAVWEPIPGLNIGAKSFSGAIVAKDDSYRLSLEAKFPGTWKPHSSVTVSNLAFTLSNTCSDTGAPCPRDASIFFSARGDVTFTLPSIGDVATTLSGTLALPSGAFSVEAKLTRSLSLGAGISINAARILIERGMPKPPEETSIESADPGGYNVDLSGQVTLPALGTLPTVHAAFSSAGWAIAVPIGSYSLPGSSGDGSKLASTVLGWSSYDTKLNIVDPLTKAVTQVALPANGFKISGEFSTPPWLRKMLGLGSDIKGRATGTFNPSADTYALRMEFDIPGQPYLYGSASTATNVALKSTYFEIARQSGDFTLGLGGAAAMNVSSSKVDLSVGLSYAVSSQTVAGTLSFSSPAGWKDAFGANDLTLYDLAIGFSFNIPSLTPGLGFGARAVLPAAVRRNLGVAGAAKTTLVANLSLDHPCLGVQVADPTNTGQTVLSIGGGGLTATVFDFQVAPTGCTIGQFRYAPGFSVNFDGKIAGVSVAIKATLGLAPFSFDGSATIGEITVGGLTIKRTTLAVAVSPDSVKIEFKGGVEVFGTNVDVAGSIRQNGTVVVTNFVGTLDKLNIGDAITASGLTVRIHTETGGTNDVLEFAARGKIRLFEVANAAADFKLSIANGQLNTAKADVVAKVQVGALALDGTFKVDYSKTAPLKVDANVAATFKGYKLLDATVVARPSYLQVSAGFSVGGVFSARLEGAAYYGNPPANTTIALPYGQVIAAQKGDWYMSARDVSVTAGGFRGSALIWIGQAGGFGRAQVNGTLQILGTTGSNTVAIKGAVDDTGDFSLTGYADLDLAGFKPKVLVTVAKSGTAVSVAGSASVSIGGGSISVDGAFSYDSGQFRFKLNGSGTISAGGYTLADSKVKFSNYPGEAGLYAEVHFNAGSTVHIDGTLNVNAEGGFYLSANANLDLRAFTVNGNVEFYSGKNTFCTPIIFWFFGFPLRVGESCETGVYPTTLKAGATVEASGFSFGVSMKITGDGGFYATARTPVYGDTVVSTPTIDLFAVRGYAEFTYHMSLTLQSSEPHVAVEGAGSASILYQHWEVVWPPWDSGWSGWKTFVTVSVRINTDPFGACAYVSILGEDVGGCI